MLYYGCVLGFSYYTLIYGRAIGPKVGDYNNIVNATIELDDDSFYRVEPTELPITQICCGECTASAASTAFFPALHLSTTVEWDSTVR